MEILPGRPAISNTFFKIAIARGDIERDHFSRIRNGESLLGMGIPACFVSQIARDGLCPSVGICAEGWLKILITHDDSGIEFLETVGAYAMGKVSLRMISDIQLNLLPVTFVVPYLLAGCADREQSGQ